MDSTYNESIANVGHAPPQQQAIYSRNAIASPLLALPFELRAEIFSLILTDVHIHVSYIDKSSDPRNADETAAGAQATQAQRRRLRAQILPSWHPSPDFQSTNTSRRLEAILRGLNLATDADTTTTTTAAARAEAHSTPLTPVWRVCRQLYAETVELPLSRCNALSFDPALLYACFADLLPAARVKRFWVYHKAQSEALLGRLIAHGRLIADGGGEGGVEVVGAVGEGGGGGAGIEIRIPTRAARLKKASTSRAAYAGPMAEGTPALMTRAEQLRMRFDALAEEERVTALVDVWEGVGAAVKVVQL